MTIWRRIPDYNWHITEGPQLQEILIGVKRRLSSFLTQKLEFKSGVSTLRPGVLLTVIVDQKKYPLLFLHLKSFDDPRGYGLRELQKAIDFRKPLQKANSSNDPVNYLFLGDLNTMGMNLTYNDNDLSGEDELERLRRRLDVKSVSMDILSKRHEVTWWPGSDGSLNPPLYR